MKTRLARAFCAVATAGITAATLGLAGAAAATQAPTSLTPPVYTTSNAGYTTGGGWHFRYVQATVTVPALQKAAGNNAIAGIGLYSGSKYLAEIMVRAGGGWGSVRYADVGYGGGPFRHIMPRVGDVITISIYRNQWNGRDLFTLYDARNGKVSDEVLATPASVVPMHATVNCWIDNSKVQAPKQDLRIWLFKDVRVTSYNGTQGTLFSRWSTYKMFDTTTGTAGGTTVMYPGDVYPDGQTFAVWLNAH
jgi:hypothetical protein